MRRWLSILLLVLLPFQFTWSVAASYCGHESAPSTHHIGHHTHQHDDGSAEKSKSPSKLAPDTDCGTCHLSAAKTVPADAAELHAPATQVLGTGAALRFSSRAPDHPERPNWRIA
ncbi:cation efflux protein, CzcI family [Roseateles depolymerans]|uniref:Cobalt-zinc-cadmium resistance protein CzcI n=1 Tax=Roseateles depolymerans TaxID=76731 RepID=A0A0U3MXQ1_9BURK|nr:cation efflux protein, CzcI family [Roseateles depolymerans]ALV09178.1 Cobalt-zinc-cadmium resistance protein CzcI [Roseateles depolymerans]REG13936.1 hypothetical protein DES44_3945 [Roseateles depolymerans]